MAHRDGWFSRVLTNNNDLAGAAMTLSRDVIESEVTPIAKTTSLPGLDVIRNNKYYPLAVQFCRYVAVGGIAFIMDFLAFNGILALQLHYMLATVIGFMVGVAVNYCLCVFWVWSGTQARTAKDILIFTLIGIGGLLLTALLMWLSVDIFSFDARLSKIVVAIIVLFWNFGLRKVFVFFK
ncbi:GtrA family protein [Cellvibrio japonicus]|nr:GtrA family protein [Cellvibrio japonicus]QEI12149.1 GtrA family protein [Cellvibrio japonicus]QEI15723.1 GtrA family protein [Cellvibrio japonicus]QEI19301.1 GtrA family protein [Cellvibrio japonicus]